MNSKLFRKSSNSQVSLDWLAALVVLQLVFLTSFGGFFIFKNLFESFRNGSGFRLFTSHHIELLSNLFPIFVCLAWVSFVEKRKVSSIGLELSSLVKDFSGGFGLGLLNFSLVALLLFIFGFLYVEGEKQITWEHLSSLLFITPFWIIQAGSEEILLRGWFMHLVGAKYGAWKGLFLSAGVFALMHIVNPGASFLSTANIFLVGLGLGLYVIKTESLWGAWGFHAAWNLVQENVYGFKVSGQDQVLDSLFSLSARGPEFFTGGDFGPEASAFSALSMGLFILVLLRQTRIRDGKEV